MRFEEDNTPSDARDGDSGDTMTGNIWQKHTSSYIFIIVTGILLLCALAVLTLICVKVYQKVVKGNQSLGICLMLGIILLYLSAYFFIFDPDPVLCRLRYVCHSFAYVICFGVMVAKGVQLRNSHTLGYNGYISFWNYWILLLFIICVQIALNLQWCMFKEPVVAHLVTAGDQTTIRCAWTNSEFLVAQVYVIALLFLSLFISLASRNVKRNYKEARWLAYTAGLCIPVWAIWMVTYATIPKRFQDTVIVVEMLTCASLILGCMFGPKLYILLSYEPILVECTPTMPASPRDGFGAQGFRIDEGYDDGGDSHCDRLSRTPGSFASTKSTAIENVATDGTKVYAAIVRKKSRSKRHNVTKIESNGISRPALPQPYVVTGSAYGNNNTGIVRNN